jgi:release factor glutamine methyltransferase
LTIRWRELRDEAVARLRAADLDDAELDVRRIAEEAGGLTPAQLVVALDEPATAREVASFDRMVARREAGEPLQYVLGRWGFRALDVLVDRRALIPRPETEVVAGHAIDALRERIGQPGRERAGATCVAGERRPELTAVDLGTGSGVIALAIAAETWPEVEVWATDASAEALDLARANLAGLGRRASVVRLAVGDWFDALPGELRGRIDVVVSNPPYVPARHPLPAEVADWEPVSALIPGPTGLEAVEVIVSEAPSWLVPGGILVVEIGDAQGSEALRIAGAAGFAGARVRPDLTGRDRVLVAVAG